MSNEQIWETACALAVAQVVSAGRNKSIDVRAVVDIFRTALEEGADCPFDLEAHLVKRHRLAKSLAARFADIYAATDFILVETRDASWCQSVAAQLAAQS